VEAGEFLAGNPEVMLTRAFWSLTADDDPD
jgi:hypothetical protein